MSPLVYVRAVPPRLGWLVCKSEASSESELVPAPGCRYNMSVVSIKCRQNVMPDPV
jgi:hypothetical protein